MIFGVPKEIKNSETRVGLLPADCKELIELGSEVLIESGAGELCGHPDSEYIEAGCKMVPTLEDIYAKSDMVIGIKELEEKHLKLLREGLIIATCLHSNAHPEEVDALLKNKVTGIAYEDILLDDGRAPVLMSQSPAAGAGAVIMAGYFMSYAGGGPGIMLAKLNGCPVANVLILGCGQSGTAAAQVAAGMGANVTMMDIDTDKMARTRSMVPSNVEFVFSSKDNIERYLEKTDLLLNCINWPKTRKDHIVTREMLQKHAKKTLFVCDVACDEFGALETCIKSTSHTDPLYELDGIRYYTVDNIPAAFGRTVCQSFTYPIMPYIKEIAKKGVVQALKDNKPLRRALTSYNGMLTLEETAIKQGREYTPSEVALGMK